MLFQVHIFNAQRPVSPAGHGSTYQDVEITSEYRACEPVSV